MRAALHYEEAFPEEVAEALAESSTTDFAALREAAAQRLTLVTYDRRTIPLLLKTWGEAGREHGGSIFVDEKSIPRSSIGGLLRALSLLYKTMGMGDWADRVVFLRK